jgi:hypothetical protein
LYKEVLSILETQLNFTTKLYKRQDGIWGMATIDKITGKLNASGMLTDLVSGKADMIVTKLAIIYERSFALDYLHPISSVYAGLFISNDKTFYDMDFIAYLEPLSNQLWLFILILAFCISAFIFLIRYVIQGKEKPVSSTKTLLYMYMKLFFGSHGLEQRQETLDLPYLTLLCDNLKK